MSDYEYHKQSSKNIISALPWTPENELGKAIVHAILALAETTRELTNAYYNSL